MGELVIMMITKTVIIIMEEDEEKIHQKSHNHSIYFI